MHVFTQQKTLHFVKNLVYNVEFAYIKRYIIKVSIKNSIIEVNYFLIIAVFMNY